MQRRFEFIGGNSAKFWEVEVSGVEVTVRYGRLGSKGQMQDKAFSDDQAASAHAEKLISEKLTKGYWEVVAA